MSIVSNAERLVMLKKCATSIKSHIPIRRYSWGGYIVWLFYIGCFTLMYKKRGIKPLFHMKSIFRYC